MQQKQSGDLAWMRPGCASCKHCTRPQPEKRRHKHKLVYNGAPAAGSACVSAAPLQHRGSFQQRQAAEALANSRLLTHHQGTLVMVSSRPKPRQANALTCPNWEAAMTHSKAAPGSRPATCTELRNQPSTSNQYHHPKAAAQDTRAHPPRA